MVRQSVDLPEPDGPITTTTSPASVRSTSFSACTSPKNLLTFSNETRAATRCLSVVGRAVRRTYPDRESRKS